MFRTNRANAGLLVLAAVAAPLFALVEPAAAASTAAATQGAAHAGEAAGCAIPAPLPILDKAYYPGHAFRYGRENTAIEIASSGTVTIEIRFAGCAGVYEHSFVFVDESPSSTYDDRDHWLRFASEQLEALKTWRRGREDVKDLLDFLSGAKIATTRRSDSEIRLEICRDGSPSAAGGCSLKSGGGWRFAARKKGGNRVEVHASRYLAMGPSKAPL